MAILTFVKIRNKLTDLFFLSYLLYIRLVPTENTMPDVCAHENVMKTYIKNKY